MGMKVYLVNQTQVEADYFEKTIYVLSSRKTAEEYCKILNKEYGNGDSHFYTVEEMELDEKLALLSK